MLEGFGVEAVPRAGGGVGGSPAGGLVVSKPRQLRDSESGLGVVAVGGV